MVLKFEKKIGITFNIAPRIGGDMVIWTRFDLESSPNV